MVTLTHHVVCIGADGDATDNRVWDTLGEARADFQRLQSSEHADAVAWRLESRRVYDAIGKPARFTLHATAGDPAALSAGEWDTE